MKGQVNIAWLEIFKFTYVYLETLGEEHSEGFVCSSLGYHQWYGEYHQHIGGFSVLQGYYQYYGGDTIQYCRGYSVLYIGYKQYCGGKKQVMCR